MKIYRRGEYKNAILLNKRGIGFEDVVGVLEGYGGILLDVIPNKSHDGELMYVLYMKNYVYVCPFIESQGMVILKTIYPERKLYKKFISGYYTND